MQEQWNWGESHERAIPSGIVGHGAREGTWRFVVSPGIRDGVEFGDG